MRKNPDVSTNIGTQMAIAAVAIGALGVGGYFLYKSFTKEEAKEKAKENPVPRGGKLLLNMKYDHIGPRQTMRIKTQLWKGWEISPTSPLPTESVMNFTIAAPDNADWTTITQPVDVVIPTTMPTGIYDITVDLMDSNGNLVTSPYRLSGATEVV